MTTPNQAPDESGCEEDPTPHGGPEAPRTLSRVALLANPAAGSGRAGGVAVDAVAALSARGIQVDLLSGDSPAHSRELAARAVADPEIDALIVCGGDGLVHLAVQAQRGSDTPIGLIPSGTGNDLAREYGIPAHDLDRAAEVVLRGRTERVDLGRIRVGGTEQVFASVACTGLDSEVNRRVNEMGYFRGRLRYVVAAALTYPRYTPKRLRLVFDGTEVVEIPVLASAYGITRYYGGGMMICPDADHGDGLLDVTYLGEVPKWRMAWSFRKVFSGRHVENAQVRTRRCRSVRIEQTDDTSPSELFADGDRVADLPVTIDVLPGAGLFLVP